MSDIPRSPDTAPSSRAGEVFDSPALPWLLFAGGMLAVTVPSMVHLWHTLWNDEAYAHGPIVLGIVLWIVARIATPSTDGVNLAHKVAGFALLAGGSAMYVVGRSQSLPILDVTALIPLAAGGILALGGRAALRRYWFALLFLVFLVPLPGFLLDMLTLPLKARVSELTESILYAAGYPVARSGVTLSIGQYQLLVADACSGLNSMFSLSAMGLLYLYLMGHRSLARNLLLVLLILPIAFLANLIRVIFLILLTYYAGDEAGQGFLHGFAGMFLFVVALLLLFGIDKLLGQVRPLADAGGHA
jgi:exosortase B